jgi:hypothetical protein
MNVRHMVSITVAAILMVGVFALSRSGDTGAGAHYQDSVYQLVNAERTDHAVTVRLAYDTRQASLMADPLLRAGEETFSGTARSSSTGPYIELVFDVSSEAVDLDGARVVFPSVTVFVAETTRQPIASGVLNGPDKSGFHVNGIEVDERADIVHLMYLPNSPGTVSIAFATLYSGDRAISALGSSGAYDDNHTFLGGSLQFPIEARELLMDDETVIEITEFRDMISAELPLPALR